MSRKIATKESVSQAANDYLMNGVKPFNITYTMVRDKMGGGSFTTIQPLLQEWLDETLKATAASRPVPADFAQAGKECTERLWQIASQRALDDLAKEIEVMDVLSAENERLHQIIEQLDTDIENLKGENHEDRRRFVACIDGIRQGFNQGCGGFFEVLKGHDDTLTVRLGGMQAAVNALLDEARDDQAVLLSRYLHERRAMGLDEAPKDASDSIPAEDLRPSVEGMFKTLEPA